MTRLGHAVTPEEYYLTLDLTGTETFTGHLQVVTKIHMSTTEIRLNSHDLKIEKILLDRKKIDFYVDDEVQEIVIKRELEFTPKEYLLDMYYTGHIQVGQHGLYRSSCNDKWIISTQFVTG